MNFRAFLRRVILLIFLAGLMTLSAPALTTPEEKARMITRPVEFDYIRWDVDAWMVKLEQTGANTWQILSKDQQSLLVLRYFYLVQELETLQAQLQQIYSNAEIENPENAAKSELLHQEELQTELTNLTPMAESILEGQVSEILLKQGIAKLGSTIPPVLFHTTPLPKALIVSPRDKIQQEVNISLLADLTLEQISELEQQVELATGESALVVDVGGIGMYPTMVMRSSNLPWILETIAHEWTHNYLTVYPLGLSYDLTPELRTINETAAAIVGNEIRSAVMSYYYPQYFVLSGSGKKMESRITTEEVFDYRKEMHITRVQVDDLLAQGKIEEAECYMEARRILFVNNGYDIRKLNQAFFAFHGAYADQPGGAAGEDPVGPVVRQLRTQSDSLAEFLHTIARMDSFEDLQAEVNSR